MTSPTTGVDQATFEADLRRLLLVADEASRLDVATRVHRLLDTHEQQVYSVAAGHMMTGDQIDLLLALAEQRQAVHEWQRDPRAFARAVRQAREQHERQRTERERSMASLDGYKPSDQVWAEAWVSACALADVTPDPDRPHLQDAINLGRKVQAIMRRRSSRGRPLTAKEREILLGPVRLARQYIEQDGQPFDPTAEAAPLTADRAQPAG